MVKGMHANWEQLIQWWWVVGLGGLLLAGGLGQELEIVHVVGFLFAIGWLVWILYERGKLVMPPKFWCYGLFLLVLVVHLSWSRDMWQSYYNWLLFLVGGLLWVGAYNSKQELRLVLGWLMLGLGMVFGAAHIGLWLVQGEYPLIARSLLGQSTHYNNHMYIGDYWAVLMVWVVYLILRKRQWIYWVLGLAGGLLLVTSLSRAAVVSLMAGLYYLLVRSYRSKKYRRWWRVLLIVAVVVFLYMGMHKSILGSRQYYVQSVAGLRHYPLGVGVGNFHLISSDSQMHMWGMADFSNLTHNIVLEMFSGIGWLALVFVFWLVMVIAEMKGKDKTLIVYEAMWLAMLVNFMLITTYVLPTMLWLWFILLGVWQVNTGEKGKGLMIEMRVDH